MTRGFSLIEFLVISIIVGVLATVVVSAVFHIRERSASATCESSYKVVETAAQVYKGQVGVYPLR